MRKLNPFKPTDIGGCALWLDGADPAGTSVLPANNSPLSIWTDKSGSGNNATTFNNLFPTFFQKSAYTNLPFVQFNGTNWSNSSVTNVTVMSLPNFQNTASVSCFYVCLGNATYYPTRPMRPLFIYKGVFGDVQVYLETNPANVGIGLGGPTFNQNISSTALGNTVYLNSAVFNSSAATFSGGQNGSNSTSSTGSSSWNTTPTSISLGAYFDTSNLGFQNLAFNGEMYEIIIFNSAVTPAQRQKIEGYLAQKWGLQGSLPAGSPGRTEVIYPRSPLIDSLTTGQATRKPFIRALRPVALGGSFQFTTTPSQYLSIPNSTAFTQNTAFTYELWYYPTSTNTGYLVAMLQSNWITVRWNTGTAGTIGLDMSYVGNPPGYVAQNRIYAINRWHHIALTWNGTNGVLYMNGVSEAVFTGAGGLVNAGNDLRIGQYQGQGQPTPLGYFTNFRWVKGVSVYTGAFTPPTAPLSVTQSARTNISAITAGQTQLLISATTSGSLLTDSSTNNFTITNNGSVAWNALTPFS